MTKVKTTGLLKPFLGQFWPASVLWEGDGALLAPHLLNLAKRIAAGERGLWEQFSTGSDDAVRSLRKSGDVDGVHSRGDDALRGGGDDTRHPNPNSTVRKQTRPALASSRNTDVMVLRTELARRGLRTSRQDKGRLEQLVQLGARAQDIHHAATAYAAKPGVNNPFAYAAQALINQIVEGRDTLQTPAIAWDEAPWQLVVAKGAELGVGTWDPATAKEHFPAYKKRVTEAMRQAENETPIGVPHQAYPP